MKSKVLFLCRENSCRSQMAEGLANKFGKYILEAHSAGSSPSGTVNPTAVELLKEKEIDISQAKSKGLSAVPDIKWDYAVAMGCEDACPDIPAKKHISWNIPDPANSSKTIFREIRNQIENEVLVLVHQIIRER